MIRRTKHLKRIFILIAAAYIAAAAVSCDQIDGFDFTPTPSTSLETLSTNPETSCSITLPTYPTQTAPEGYYFSQKEQNLCVFTAPDGRIFVIMPYRYYKTIEYNNVYFRFAELYVHETYDTPTATRTLTHIGQVDSTWNMCIDRIDGTDYLCIFQYKFYNDENNTFIDKEIRYLYSLEDYNLIEDSTVEVNRNGEDDNKENLTNTYKWISGGKADKLYVVNTETERNDQPGIFVDEYDTSTTSIALIKTVNLLDTNQEKLSEFSGYTSLYTCCPDSLGGFVLLAERNLTANGIDTYYSAVIRVDENLTVTSAAYLDPIFKDFTKAAVLESSGGLYYLNILFGGEDRLIHIDADYNPLSLNTVSGIGSSTWNKPDLVLTDSELLLVIEKNTTIEIKSYKR